MAKPVTFEEVQAAASLGFKGRAPRLAQLADFIRESLPQYKVSLEESRSSTDRPAGRLRIPGKGRSGKKLVVRQPGTYGYRGIVFQHDSSEAYRTNGEVCRWIMEQMENQP